MEGVSKNQRSLEKHLHFARIRLEEFIKSLKAPFSVIQADLGSGPGEAPGSGPFKG